MGHATFGSSRPQLAPGDYLAYVKDVELGETEDLKDKTKKKPVFIFGVDLTSGDGEWESRKLYSSRTFTDMAPKNGKKPEPQFVSTLNKLVKACGQRVPQTLAEVEAWDEEDLTGSYFIWRMEEDEETGSVVRKYLSLKANPELAKLVKSNGAAAKGAKGKASTTTAEADPDSETEEDDPFTDE